MKKLKPLLKPPMVEHLTPVRLREMEKLNEAIHRLRAVKTLRKSPQPVAVALDPHRLLAADVKCAMEYVRPIVVESDGYPMLHSADALRTILMNAFISGAESARLRGAAAVRVEE